MHASGPECVDETAAYFPKTATRYLPLYMLFCDVTLPLFHVSPPLDTEGTCAFFNQQSTMKVLHPVPPGTRSGETL